MFLKRSNSEFKLEDPEISSLGSYSKESKTYIFTKYHSQRLVAALSTIVKKLKLLKQPPTNGQTKCDPFTVLERMHALGA